MEIKSNDENIFGQVIHPLLRGVATSGVATQPTSLIHYLQMTVVYRWLLSPLCLLPPYADDSHIPMTVVAIMFIL